MTLTVSSGKCWDIEIGYLLYLQRKPLLRFLWNLCPGVLGIRRGGSKGSSKKLIPWKSFEMGVAMPTICALTTCVKIIHELTSKTGSSGTVIQPSIAVQIVQIIIGMLVMDTWQYFVHRYMHQNKFLYRHVHSQHHKLVVPYAIGALYNHPLEGLLLDTVGGAISFLVSGMTARTAVIFFCFAVIKTVDDHCGLWLPGNIFHLLIPEQHCLS
ncbi:Sphinganine C4-monooxygenase 2 [Vitis vinifera]|uniref:Sphinganine C4-monooxygenase 2 n=1 Tax=Vitis vinifera TaxID=29760 RepID=A0A438GAP4_VITVI|nr:Sphinganine C4-monooxygenase 2 [Vitis vinifera]